jgi:Tol biopolymer transport system component/tRNA A-37 threonylcarbamoyl transferase component Bud32
MSLAPQTRLGPYEIISRLGVGAMGEVYRAQDPRLGRDVAIKILPADVSADPSRRARFEQEARAVAALNHPNILGLYDIGSEDGISYIVTEFVAGETLAAILERGPLPVRKLLDIAVQIAGGMAAAHAARITHRDLKPLNIMVSGEGRVKILDFGLAKQAVLSADPDETVVDTQTQPGMILGTVNYMSPEQARGMAADYRSDQFSFGLILYEMASGKRPFDRPESVQTMSAIIAEDPPPIEQNIPGPLSWSIDRCLAKNPADRYESSRDLFQLLKSMRDHTSDFSGARASAVVAAPAAPVAPTSAGRLRLWLPAATFVMGLAAAFALHFWRSGPITPDQSAYRFTPFSFSPGGQYSPVWSPDGKSVAYAARGEGEPYQTYIRYLDSATPVRITHTEEDASPLAWAPDGKRLLLTIDRQPDAIWSIATVGGDPEIVVPSVPPTQLLSISPDNQSVAYFYPGDEGRYGVWISSPPTAAPKRYLPDPYATKDIFNRPKLKFSPDGKQILLLLNAGRQREETWLLPYPADPSRPAHRVLTDLQSAGGTPVACWMPDSRHVVLALSTKGDSSEQLWLADTVSGEYHALTSGTTSRSSPAVSPDGQRLIFKEGTGSYDIVSVDLKNAAVHPLIATERDELMPSWAANKPLLTYVTDRNGPQEIWLHTADNADRPLVTARDFPGAALQWLMGPALSPEGDRVVYTRIDIGGKANRLWISAVAGGTPVPLTNDEASSEFPGSWSLDGSWFVYVCFQDGKPNLMKVKTSGQAAPVVLKADVTYDNEAVPLFSPDGALILLGETVYSADGKTSRLLGDHHSQGYVFASDGKRIYGLRPLGDGEQLFSVELAAGTEKVIGNLGGEYRPRSNLNPSTHFSVTPDGRSITYAIGKFKENLWMLEGFAAKRGLLARFGL